MSIENKINNKENLQVVIFRLGEDYLSCPISQVREIIQLEEITPVPSTPDMIKGIINRRGTIITILNLPKVLGIDLDLNENNSQLMILYSEDEDIGMMVSEVTEIPTINTEEIEEPSKALETPINEKYLEGILKQKGNLVLLTDLIKLVDSVSDTELEKAKNFSSGV